jgi:thiol-disulfide isomerase/thioredoxin
MPLAARSSVVVNRLVLMTHSEKPSHVRFVVPSVVVIVSILLLTFSAAAQRKTAHKARSTSAVQPAGPVRAVNAEEMQALLKRDGKRPLLVNYWATWCDPCRDEFPDLVKIDRDYRAKGLDFIAITLDDLVDIKTAVPKFLQDMNAKMPVYLLNVADPEPAINMVDRDWSGALPASFLYDNTGKVVYKHFGRVNPGELRAAIEKLVGSKQ